MKTLIILTLVALAVAEWELKTREEYTNIRRRCLERFQLSNEFGEKHKNDKYPPKEGFQIILCYFRGLEIYNDVDGYLVDRIIMGLREVKMSINNYNEVLLRQGLKNCIGEGSSQFEEAYRSFKCFIDNEYLYDAMNTADFYKNDRKV